MGDVSVRRPRGPGERCGLAYGKWASPSSSGNRASRGGPADVPVMGRRGSTICDRICLVGARGWLLIGGDQVVVALRMSAATATINRTVAGAMALSRTRRWDAIAPRK